MKQTKYNKITEDLKHLVYFGIYPGIHKPLEDLNWTDLEDGIAYKVDETKLRPMTEKEYNTLIDKIEFRSKKLIMDRVTKLNHRGRILRDIFKLRDSIKFDYERYKVAIMLTGVLKRRNFNINSWNIDNFELVSNNKSSYSLYFNTLTNFPLSK